MRRHKPSLFLSADFYEAVKRQRKASTLHTIPCHLRYFSTIIKLLLNLNRNNDIMILEKVVKLQFIVHHDVGNIFCSNSAIVSQSTILRIFSILRTFRPCILVNFYDYTSVFCELIIAVPLELLFPLSLLEGSPPGNSAIRRHTESYLFIHKYTAHIQMYCVRHVASCFSTNVK